ncbi:DUF5690 family protein [Arcticibacter eurypsychrophilus]|uniref:DUF5690 family protein n=1 Tax=Arcticibacter eurypsychrophilus TaxID=1434752 RepID=UPI00084E0923|nr:DUF5690 family protein [Arcticibacter eurypsychrophilus]
MNKLLKYGRKQAAKLSFPLITVVTALAAFGCYTSMYAFRKAFTAGTFDEGDLLGINYKVWLVIAQVFGYMLSKFYGIRFIAEQGYNLRAPKILLLIGISWFALFGFALVPAPFNIVFLFINGLPLGLIWGLVFSYLEGRRTTELLGAVMSVSLVFASGLVKTIGSLLILNAHVSVYWMPFFTGLLFVVPLLICTFLLEVMPPPDVKDLALRTVRTTMNGADRKNFLMNYLPGLAVTVIIYVLFTVLRDVRDNFEVEIWADIGITDNRIYAQTNSIIALVVLVMVSLLIVVKNNLAAFTLIHGMIISGCLMAVLATWLMEKSLISNVTWMSVTGLSIYMVYIPYNAIFFERLLATFRCGGNIGFIMYVADACGYLGSVAVLLVRELSFVQLSWGHFFINAIWNTALLAGVLACLSLFYFRNKYKKYAITKEVDDAYVLTSNSTQSSNI